MRAVNLIPSEDRRSPGVQASLKLGPGYLLIALLGVAVLFVTIYVLSSNKISSRKAQLASLQGQVSQEQALANRLGNYAAFVKLAQTRADTIRQIVDSRFDWHAALSDLSRVIPADTSLQSLGGTVGPGASVGGAGGSVGGGASGSSLRGDIPVPAFELQGCTRSQDDVARLMSRLRLINGVQRVSLAGSVKQEGTSGTAVAAGSAGAGAGCGPGGPAFDLVVFFQALPSGGTSAATPGAAVSTPAATSSSSAPTATTATPATPAPTSGSSQPVSNGAPSGGGSK